MAGIGELIGKVILRKQMKTVERETRVCNFKEASTAVLIFDASEPGIGKTLKELRNFLKTEGVVSTAFGLNREKEVPQDLLFMKDLHIINRKNLNIFKKAKGEIAELYKQQEPDMLIDLTRNFPLDLQFLLQPSMAGFKIGCYTEEQNDYDLMIHLKQEEDISYFAEQIKHYISILEPSK